MLKMITILLTFVLTLYSSSVWAAHSTQLTTYYPAPAGNYQQVKITPWQTSAPIPACKSDLSTDGTIFYGIPDVAHSLGIYYCQNGQWLSFAGHPDAYWFENSTTHLLVPINSTDRIGIGTRAPISLLTVGSGTIPNAATPFAGINVATTVPNSTTNQPSFVNVSDNATQVFLGAYSTTLTDSYGMIGTYGNQDIVIKTNNLGQVRLTAGGPVGTITTNNIATQGNITTGNVGIGTNTTTNAPLEVNNSMKFTNNSLDANDGVIGNAPLSIPGLNIVGINTGSGRKITLSGSINQTDNPLGNSFIGNTTLTGHVGIGTLTLPPLAGLTVQNPNGSGSPNLLDIGGTGDGRIRTPMIDGKTSSSDKALYLQASNGQDVSMGTSSSGSKLIVNGNISSTRPNSTLSADSFSAVSISNSTADAMTASSGGLYALNVTATTGNIYASSITSTGAAINAGLDISANSVITTSVTAGSILGYSISSNNSNSTITSTNGAISGSSVSARTINVGNSTTSGLIKIAGKEAIQETSSSLLQLDPNGKFSSGISISGNLAVDGKINISGTTIIRGGGPTQYKILMSQNGSGTTIWQPTSILKGDTGATGPSSIGPIGPTGPDSTVTGATGPTGSATCGWQNIGNANSSLQDMIDSHATGLCSWTSGSDLNKIIFTGTIMAQYGLSNSDPTKSQVVCANVLTSGGITNHTTNIDLTNEPFSIFACNS
ncbi:MAG: hypothetical protein HQL15_07675 [Candidatus Omnitrophica bacterium]|nr:hypothetical protein [Candidatus Omnitrophota bacterium]